MAQIKHTATADTKFALTYGKLWAREANFHVLTHAARYGDYNITSANPSIAATNGISFQDCDISQFFFMNSAAGDNTTIICIYVPMTKKHMEELGVQ